jgi:hypothetical protein
LWPDESSTGLLQPTQALAAKRTNRSYVAFEQLGSDGFLLDQLVNPPAKPWMNFFWAAS